MNPLIMLYQKVIKDRCHRHLCLEVGNQSRRTCAICYLHALMCPIHYPWSEVQYHDKVVLLTMMYISYFILVLDTASLF